MPRKKTEGGRSAELVGARVIWYLDGGPRDVSELAELVGRSASQIQKLLDELKKRECFEDRGSARAARPRSGAARGRPVWTLKEPGDVPVRAKFGTKGTVPRRGSLLYGAAIALHARAAASGHAKSEAAERFGVGANETLDLLVSEGLAFAGGPSGPARLVPGRPLSTDGRLRPKLAELREAKGLSLRALASEATRHYQDAGYEGVIHHGLLARIEEGALPPAAKLDAIMTALSVSESERVHLIRTWWKKKKDPRGVRQRPSADVLEDWRVEVAESAPRAGPFVGLRKLAAAMKDILS